MTAKIGCRLRVKVLAILTTSAFATSCRRQWACLSEPEISSVREWRCVLTPGGNTSITPMADLRYGLGRIRPIDLEILTRLRWLGSSRAIVEKPTGSQTGT